MSTRRPPAARGSARGITTMISVVQTITKGMLIRKISRQDPIAKSLSAEQRPDHSGDRPPGGPAADRPAAL